MVHQTQKKPMSPNKRLKLSSITKQYRQLLKNFSFSFMKAHYFTSFAKMSRSRNTRISQILRKKHSLHFAHVTLWHRLAANIQLMSLLIAPTK